MRSCTRRHLVRRRRRGPVGLRTVLRRVGPHDALQTSFSVAKSFVSTLVGIAIDEGLIGGVADRVTEYLKPDGGTRGSIEHAPGLLDMSSGLRQ